MPLESQYLLKGLFEKSNIRDFDKWSSSNSATITAASANNAVGGIRNKINNDEKSRPASRSASTDMRPVSGNEVVERKRDQEKENVHTIKEQDDINHVNSSSRLSKSPSFKSPPPKATVPEPIPGSPRNLVNADGFDISNNYHMVWLLQSLQRTSPRSDKLEAGRVIKKLSKYADNGFWEKNGVQVSQYF